MIQTRQRSEGKASQRQVLRPVKKRTTPRMKQRGKSPPLAAFFPCRLRNEVVFLDVPPSELNHDFPPR